MTPANGQVARRPLRWRALALPVEHGAWPLIGEPILLGLGWMPAWSGVAVAGAGVAALLASHPLGLALADLRRGRRYRRTGPALALAIAYGVLALAGLAGAAALGGRAAALVPLALALPLATLQTLFRSRNRARHVVAEVAGAVAAGSLAAAVAVAGGAPLLAGAVLWGVAAARNAPSVLYVRARLARLRGRPQPATAALATHLAALAAIAALTAGGLLPWTAAAAFAVLLARCLVGLRPAAGRSTAVRVGATETAFGVAVVAAVLVGRWWGP